MKHILLNETTFVPKGWGWEDWITNDPDANYCLKRMFIKAGKRGSLHCHLKKDETLVLLSGQITVAYCDRPWDGRIVPNNINYLSHQLSYQNFTAGDQFRFKPKEIHRLYADRDAILMEASTFHADDDVVRFEAGDLLPGQTVDIYTPD
jgi:hypothetical protein